MKKGHRIPSGRKVGRRFLEKKTYTQTCVGLLVLQRTITNKHQKKDIDTDKAKSISTRPKFKEKSVLGKGELLCNPLGGEVRRTFARSVYSSSLLMIVSSATITSQLDRIKTLLTGPPFANSSFSL
ncbi:hypothetical protein MG293_017083 [Ovis ammon polii]|uniref:Uncharacterized protein n=1 Tax=Ovis ammon polii TaxID=230172 RepID=A0AAD4Y029_OVIAM|nr:hypothetical protein MG293_017083 [Ovis ammon polii]